MYLEAHKDLKQSQAKGVWDQAHRIVGFRLLRVEGDKAKTWPQRSCCWTL